jgi:peptide/nickel transport system ATP-binding protein
MGTVTRDPAGRPGAQAEAAEVAVRVSGLSVTTTGPSPYTVVADVDLELRAGEVLGVVGESGSGKTTVALALLGYARPGMQLHGSVQVAGVDMIDGSDAEVRHARGAVISYVPQDPSASLNPARRIGAQLRERLKIHDRLVGEPEARLAEVLARVQLPSSREFLRRYPHQLSGGQLQRVCIAMAVLCRPRVIVLDEPTTGLDVMTQTHVLELLREVIAEERTAAFYVTHDLAVVSAVAQRVAVMYAGLLVEEGPTEVVTARPSHPYSRGLIRSTPSIHTRRALTGIAGTPLSPRQRGAGCPFAARCELVVDACRESLPSFDLLAEPGRGPDVGAHRVRCLRADAEPAPTVVQVTDRPLWASSDTTAAPVAELDRVNAFYGSHQVLHDISFKVGLGECVAVVGESGSGKTTLARCISGLHTGRAEGVLLFKNRELRFSPIERTDDERRRIQYVFQSPYGALNPRHTIGRSIGLPLELARLSETERGVRVRELLERVGLGAGYEARYPAQLSGGERQRVAIARALAAEPSLLVCDEITSALDVSIQASILDLLGELRRDLGLTMLFITHHLALVRTVADRGLVMQHGRVVEAGSATELLDNPRHAYTRELIRNTPSMREDGPNHQKGSTT